jgi:hypothetical protein
MRTFQQSQQKQKKIVGSAKRPIDAAGSPVGGSASPLTGSTSTWMLEIMDHIRTDDWMALELDSYQADVLDDVTVVMEEAISSNLTYPNHLNNSAILGKSQLLIVCAQRNKVPGPKGGR